MEKITKILAPTDLSEQSRVGVRHAMELAKVLGAEVTVYHVISQGELMHYHHEIYQGRDQEELRPLRHPLETYTKALTEYMRSFSDLTSQVKVKERVEMGVPVSNIVNLAENEKVNLIVISTHGRTGLSHMLVGSVTEKVVRLARCPVLSVHPGTDGAAP
ncbi:MAG TPA: universal stress protein [Candidatus Binatia bacterium]